MIGNLTIRLVFSALIGAWVLPISADAQRLWPFERYPEAQQIGEPDPSSLPAARVPEMAPPETVLNPNVAGIERLYSLDACLQETLATTDVVRILTGIGSAHAGITIYDPAIATSAIDREQARFDPQLRLDQLWRRFDQPGAIFNPNDPLQSLIVGSRTDDYNLALDLSQTNPLGGVGRIGVGVTGQSFQGGTFPLNPQNRSQVEFQYTQPLLQGGGRAVNETPIVLARIDTERSFFQLKDSLQEMVRGVISSYWSLAAARVEVMARRKQVTQAEEAVNYTQARKDAGFGDLGDLAQARLGLANFKASLIASQASLADREAALRSIMGLSPSSEFRLVPSTIPINERIDFNWARMIQLAEAQRPDIIELKLVLEADQQSLLVAKNQSLPRLDAVALYRWNGLEGEMPVGDRLRSAGGRFTDWTIGVNFSVPLGLRRERAGVRRQELVILKDEAFLRQGIHNMTQTLAYSVRRVASSYAQFTALQETRQAAQENLQVQRAEYLAGRTILLNVLQAIADFGNAVAAEAQSLANYNAELANLERESGTILESHGIRLFEERNRTVGPFGRFGHERLYPQSLRPSESEHKYPANQDPWDRILERDFQLSSKPWREQEMAGRR